MKLLVLTLLLAASVVYYLLVYLPRPRAIVYTGSDRRLAGEYLRLKEKTTNRTHYTTGRFSTADFNTPWSNEVWQNQKNPLVCIFDHRLSGGQHMWSIGAWDPMSGGSPPQAAEPQYGQCYAPTRKARSWWQTPIRMQDALHGAVVVSAASGTTGRFLFAPTK